MLARPDDDRWAIAEYIEQRLSPAMSALGIIFLFVVLGAELSRDGGAVDRTFELLVLVLWGIFGIEYAARLVIAPSRLRFLRRTWWQLLLLLVPFLRFVRLLRLVRVTRGGRILSSAVRSTRSAHATLASRVGWLASVTAIVILASSQLLYLLGAFPTYGEALYRTAFTTIASEPMGVEGTLMRLIEIALATYAVVVFATLAGIVGSYLLRQDEVQQPSGGSNAR